MPTYEYACRDCGHTFEIVQSMKDESLTVCPRCGGRLRKVFTAPAIAFKGSGFYATDQRKKATSAAGDAKEGGGSESATSDAKSRSGEAGPDQKDGQKGDKKGDKKDRATKDGTTKDGTTSDSGHGSSSTPTKKKDDGGSGS